MRKYYARFFREVGHSVFTFWKEQVVGGLAAGGVTAIVNTINGVTPEKVALASVCAVVLGYLVLLGIGFICSVICAPVNLDNARQQEGSKVTSDLQASHEKIIALKAQIAELQRPRRTPSQQIAFDRSSAELAVCNASQCQFLRALLHREKVEHMALNQQLTREGMTNTEWSDAIDRFRRHPVLVENIGATPLDQHNYWRVNPHLRDALIELLVTPADQQSPKSDA